MEEELDLEVGCFVFLDEWIDGSWTAGTMDRPNVGMVHALQPDDGTATITFFYHPSQTSSKGQSFYEHEVLASSERSKVRISAIVGLCHVMSLNDYQHYDPVGPISFEEDDIFLCRARYIRQRNQIQPYKSGFLAKQNKQKTVERSQPRILVSAEQNHGQVIALAIDKIEIEFVADKDIPNHIVNVVSAPPEPLKSVKLGSQKIERRGIRPFSGNDGDADQQETLDDDQLATKNVVDGRQRSITTASNADPSPLDSVVGHRVTFANDEGDISSGREDFSDDDSNSNSSADEDDFGDDVGGATGFSEQALRDDYFHQSKRRKTTSNRTLAKLDAAIMDQTEVAELLSTVDVPYDHARRVLHQNIESNTSSWPAYLAHNFNILCYGFGSKKRMIMEFVAKRLANSVVMVVNGYFPSLSVKQILKTLIEESLGYDGSFRHVSEQLRFIKSKFNDLSVNVPEHYVIIHNIDGATIRNETSQMVLSTLAEMSKIHMIASIDHINAPLMWDHEKLSRFNWVWVDCTTFEPYVNELSYDNTVASRSGGVTVAGAMEVMRSLTKNGRQVFWILLLHQMEHGSEADYHGMRFNKYLAQCQKQFAAHNDSRLRSYMTELLDHKLITTAKPAGVEHVKIPSQNTVLQAVLDNLVQEFTNEAPR